MTSAARVEELVMEMGGKDPLIVLEDADIERAARLAVASSFENAGQMCVSTERILVDEKIADEFEELAAAMSGGIRSAPGLTRSQHRPYHQR